VALSNEIYKVVLVIATKGANMIKETTFVSFVITYSWKKIRIF
jgi:hypothetical protein